MDSEILSWSYDICRCDRSDLNNTTDCTRGSGVLLASRCNLPCKPVFMHENNEREYAAIELNADKYGKILLAVFYRPLNANSVWVQHFIKTLANCTYEKILLLGIFPSVNLIGGSGFCNSSDSALFSFCQVLIEINSFS